MCWGKHTYNGQWQTVTLPTSYTSATFVITCCQWTLTNRGGSMVDTVNMNPGYAKTNTTFTIGADSSGGNVWGMFWITLGY